MRTNAEKGEEIEGEEKRTVHPPKPFARDHLEVDALVAVLGVDEVRELHCVELYPYEIAVRESA